MLRLRKWIVPVAGIALLMGLNLVHGEDAPAPAGKAKITVTVVDKGGAPVADVPVNLVKSIKREKSADAAEKPAKPTPLATVTTDKDGKASFPNIADGDYGVMAKLKAVGNGKSKVSVTGGADAEVTITLAPKKAAAATPAPPAEAK